VNRLIILITAVAIVLIGPAYASGFRPFVTSATAPITVAGFIGEDGSIIHGHGFTVKHNSTGHYLIEFDPGVFPGCAAMTVEGFEHPVLSAVYVYPIGDCRFPEWHVGLSDPRTNAPIDAIFGFTAVEVPQRR
jgi:hypothetical protein